MRVGTEANYAKNCNCRFYQIAAKPAKKQIGMGVEI